MSLDWSILQGIESALVCPALDFLMPKITALGNGGAVCLLASRRPDLHEEVPEAGDRPAGRAGRRRSGWECASEEPHCPPAALLAGQQRPASDRRSPGLLLPPWALLAGFLLAFVSPPELWFSMPVNFASDGLTSRIK